MHVINVMAMSLDAQIASHATERDEVREAQGFTNPDDRDHLLALVRTADAVIVGSRSLLASGGGAFEERNAAGDLPVWVVMTNAGLPPNAAFWQQEAVPRCIASRAPLAFPAHAGSVAPIVYGTEPPARRVVQALEARGVRRVLLFGGSEINRAFYAEGLVNELWITVCPLILGAKDGIPLVKAPLPAPTHLRLVTSQCRGDLVFLNYTVHVIRTSHAGDLHGP